MPADLAILFEHPDWFRPLFAALERRGIVYQAINLNTHLFDPADRSAPAPVVFNRVAMSAATREAEHGIFYAQGLLAHWQRAGAKVINGADVLAIDANKARQLSLIAGLGLDAPATRVVHRRAELLAAADAIGFPLLVKANIGGAGAGIQRFDSRDALAAAIANGTVPTSIDNVLLVQDYVPARGGTITRIETLNGRFLYAMEVTTGDTFDLCPADACVVTPGRPAVTMTRVEPKAEIVAAAERIVQAAGIEVGGVELVVDDRDGAARFYDVNALSNFVANPLDVLGFDPHERLVDWLETRIAKGHA